MEITICYTDKPIITIIALIVTEPAIYKGFGYYGEPGCNTILSSTMGLPSSPVNQLF
jgi:hypothetical protein